MFIVSKYSELVHSRFLLVCFLGIFTYSSAFHGRKVCSTSFRMASLHPIASHSNFNSSWQPTSTLLHSSISYDPEQQIDDRKLSPWQRIRRQWFWSIADMRRNPWQYLSIPIMAAIVGYVTNWLGVSMLFYPIKWTGWSLKRWPEQPFGLIGWQGVVPAKRFQMTRKLVDVTINRLVQVKEVFAKLEAAIMAKILVPTVTGAVFNGMAPRAILEHILNKVATDMIVNIEHIVDIPRIVINGMTKDPRTLGSFFQRVGSKELKFLVDSGTYCGFALGVLQMIQWMVFPKNWTLPLGGALVGYVTNWIALKWIFEPLNPKRVGPLVFQGLFLARQREVSAEFCSYLAQNILTSQQVWSSILTPGSQSLLAFRALVLKHSSPWLSLAAVEAVLSQLRSQLSQPNHPLHVYINRRINLRALLTLRMNQLTPAQFEQVLHPVFQEDEFTLMVAGGLLGLLAGAAQWWLNLYFDKQRLIQQQQQQKPLILPSVSSNVKPLSADAIAFTPTSAMIGDSDQNTVATDHNMDDIHQKESAAEEVVFSV